MKVKEVIERLQDFSPDANVYVEHDDGMGGVDCAPVTWLVESAFEAGAVALGGPSEGDKD